MRSHQPEVFGTTLQKTNLLLKQLGDTLHWDDHHKAYHGLRAVLHALRDRLPVPEAAHLGAQLPMLVRGSLNAIELSEIRTWQLMPHALVLPSYAPCVPQRPHDALAARQAITDDGDFVEPVRWCGPWAVCRNTADVVSSALLRQHQYQCVPRFATRGQRCGLQGQPLRCADGLVCGRDAWSWLWWLGRGQRHCMASDEVNDAATRCS